MSLGDGDADSWRGRLGEGVGSPGAGMGWGRGCDVARRCACVTPASRGRLGVIATGLGKRPEGREAEAFCGDAEMPVGPI